MDRALISALRARGVDVLTAQEADMIERLDEDHLTLASNNGGVLTASTSATIVALHAHGTNHAGLVLALQQRYSVGEQTRRLLRLTAARTAEEMQNRIEFLRAWG